MVEKQNADYLPLLKTDDRLGNSKIEDIIMDTLIDFEYSWQDAIDRGRMIRNDPRREAALIEGYARQYYDDVQVVTDEDGGHTINVMMPTDLTRIETRIVIDEFLDY